MKKLSFQKIFCFLSILFLASCCIFYGTRFLKLFIDNQKKEKREKDSIVKRIKESNEDSDTFIKVEDEMYFINKPKNNYISYSNIIWRIIKVNADNSFTAISDNALTSLAFGKEVKYSDSMINKWLNFDETDKYSGILERELNTPEKYLVKTETCLDIIDSINNNPCKNVDKSNYLSLLSTIDFANIGNKSSFVINDEFFYLGNINKKNEIWYVTNDGKVTLNSGTDIIGVRPVITIKPNVDYISGDGTSNDPYVIDGDSLFGSYVKLGNDLWRVYEVNGSQLRLMLNDYLKVGENNLTHSYSSNSSYHNDTVNGSLAYYLNHDYYNSLSYKDLITEKKWSNGFYNSSNNYDYETSLSKEVDTKIATLSIGNIFLNPEFDNFFSMTSTTDNGSIMYTIQKDKKPYSKSVQAKLNVIPAITIDKNVLKKGNGTINNPYETEKEK